MNRRIPAREFFSRCWGLRKKKCDVLILMMTRCERWCGTCTDWSLTDRSLKLRCDSTGNAIVQYRLLFLYSALSPYAIDATPPRVTQILVNARRLIHVSIRHPPWTESWNQIPNFFFNPDFPCHPACYILYILANIHTFKLQVTHGTSLQCQPQTSLQYQWMVETNASSHPQCSFHRPNHHAHQPPLIYYL
jgi:hypothetical protein